MAVVHDFVSAIPDGADATVVRPSNWNADHTVEDNTFVAAKLSATDDTILFGRATAGAGAGEEIIIGTNLSLTGTTLNAASGSSTWDTIAAAAGDGSTDNGDNNIVYRVAKTTNTEISWRFTESAAATNGTSTSGVPNQVLLKVDTVAASTMSPLSVYSRAAHVFSVSPTAAQILATNGTNSLPVYGFAGDIDTGIYYGTFYENPAIAFAVAGVAKFSVGGNQVYHASSSSTIPTYTGNPNGESGLTFPGTAVCGIAISLAESVRWALDGSSNNLMQASNAQATTAGYSLNFRKARGTVAAPTVITTGDDLATIKGFGYVGATGTYVEGCRITFDSTGTIANTTSGLGGIMRLACAVVGTVGPVEIAQVNGTEQHLLHVGTVPVITSGFGTDPTIAGTDEAFTITVGTGGIALTGVITFAKPFTVAPRCTANHQGAVLILRCVSTTTTVTVDAATPFTTSGLIDVICRSGTT